MKKRYILFILFILIIVCIIYIKHTKVMSNITDISEYDPFKNTQLYSDESINKIDISTDMPKIAASTAFYPLAAGIVQNTYNEEKYNNELRYESTTKVYELLLENNVDIAIVSKPSEEQRRLIEKSGKNIKFVPIAKDALIFYTRKENKLNSLTIEEIQRIYTNETNIKTYQLEKNNGSQTCFEDIVRDNKIDNKNHFEVNDMGKIIEDVVINRNSIGYAFNSFYTKIYNNRSLKLLKINDIEPNDENIILGIYPLMYDIYFVYDMDNSNENIQEILNWSLSENGQKLAEKICFQKIK